VLIGLGAALLGGFAVGGAVFLGGRAARAAPAAKVAQQAYVASVVMVAVALLAVRPSLPEAQSMAAGLLSGALSAAGIVYLYRALAVGPMATAAAISASGTAVVPLVFAATLMGADFGLAHTVGIGLIVGGVALSGSLEWRSTRGVVLNSLVAAGFFGVALTSISVAAASGPLWAVASSRAGAAIALTLIGRESTTVGVWRRATVIGALDVSASLLFVVGASLTDPGTAATLISLYPLVTMLLARVVLGEHLGPGRGISVSLAIVGILLIGLAPPL
jgi:drug/metabolite transporter (DMT)-like permease